MPNPADRKLYSTLRYPSSMDHSECEDKKEVTKKTLPLMTYIESTLFAYATEFSALMYDVISASHAQCYFGPYLKFMFVNYWNTVGC